jgi:two-component system NtrC family sensor kinase
VTILSRPTPDEHASLAALARSEGRYVHLVESAADGIFTLDARGTLTAANESLERASGRTRAELIGLPFADLVDPRDRCLADEAVREAIDGQWRRVDLRYAGPNGAVRHCSLTLTPTAPELDAGIVLGVVRDTTDEKRLAEQLIQQEKLAAVGQLVSGVAHELNNPLASVMAFAQLLLAAPDGAPCDRRAVEAIHQETKRAARIVSNLLTFARQQQGERCVADLNRVVDDTLDLRRYALRNENIEVETSLDAMLPLTWADPHQLQQVVLNLVSNAEQALIAWPDAPARRISVATSCRGDTLTIRVADSGPGIAPEHVNRIFNPFFTTKPVGEGTGLGLSISDGIVREHGGRIRVESQLGRGATFLVELPLVPPPDGDVEQMPVVETPPARVLYVDHDRPYAKH